MSNTVLFIDAKVIDYETLLAGLSSNVEVHILNAQEDGVLQMAHFLKGRTGLDSIQIVSHGSSGALSLGSSILSNDNLSHYTNALNQIGACLSATGDMQLYGCNIAQGDSGLNFIKQLSTITGADVAASDDLTGNSQLGGDWELETTIGTIESNTVFSSNALNSYATVLVDDYAANLSTTGNISTTFSVNSITASIETGYDQDWFKVSLVGGRTYIIDLKAASTGNGTLYDPYFYGIFYNSTGTPISLGYTNDDISPGVNRNSQVTFTPTLTGNYYLAAGGYGVNTGTYQLSVTVVDDYAASTATLGTLAVGSFISGDIEAIYALDNDWFKVSLVAGKNYTIDLKGAATSNGNLYNPSFTGIYDSTGVYLGFADEDSGYGNNARVSFTPTATGNYYLAATGHKYFDDWIYVYTDTGTYQLSVNPSPTLTSFAAAIATGKEDKTITVTFANLQAQGNEADSNGTVVGFVVKTVSSGTLKIGLNASVATPWNPLSNNTIDATHLAFWTPAANANGTLNAFEVVAKDNNDAESVTVVQTQIAVSAVADVNISAGINPVEGPTVKGNFTITLDSPAPVGGLTVNYSLTGTATVSTDYTLTAGSNITGLTGSSFTIAAGQTSASLNVNALADTLAEPGETVGLNLTNALGYQLDLENTALSFSKTTYSISTTPYVVSTGDFNNDGKLDLATIDYSGSIVSVLLRNATNTGFDTKVDYVTGANSHALAVGDLNNDGKLDLVTANDGAASISVLMRNAANTGFDTKIDYATGANPHSVVVGDFNNDGKLDLAVANHGSGSVSVFLRNSANTGFETKLDYYTGSVGLYSITAGDFNNDGQLDLAVANYSVNKVSVLLRNANNTGFNTQLNYDTGLSPYHVSAADFNGDGKLDLAVTNNSANSVSILLRNAANTGFDPKIDYSISSSAYDIKAADFNNDGKTDFAVISYTGDTLSVFLRNAANTDFNPRIDYATGSGPTSVNTGDFNNDGRLDLAVTNYNNPGTLWLLQNSSNPNAGLTIINNNPATGVVTINDTTPLQAQKLTVSNTLADADGIATPIAYQWKANNINISGATSGSYLVTRADLGKVLSVTASYTDTKGTFTSVSSTVTAAVAKNFANLVIYGDLGGSKKDILEGASGNDALYGLNMDDRLSGYEGNDTLNGGLGLDSLYGGDGNDELWGGYDKDSLYGDAGNDVLYGEQGADLIEGGTGNDTLDGGLGLDTMSGGDGNDTYYVGDDLAIDNVSDNGLATDVDTIIMRSQLNSYTLGLGIENGELSAGTNSANLIGNLLNNKLTGNGGNNQLKGGFGNDTLYAASGNDSVDAGDGNDEIIGGDGYGDDYYVGGVGMDTVKYTSSSTGIIVTLATGKATGSQIGTDTLDGIENIIGGQAGDTLSGDANNNVINGYTGSDTMTGGLGNDTYVVNVTTDIVVELSNQGTDLIQSVVSYNLSDTDGAGTNGGNVENLTLIGTATISGVGNGLKNTLTGNDAANFLNGGLGNDTLTSGGGADVLRFNSPLSATNIDKITDYNVANDTIQLENAIFSKLTLTGNLNAANFKLGAAAADANDFIVYNQATGALFYDADGNSAAGVAAVQIALIGNLVALTAADFVVV